MQRPIGVTAIAILFALVSCYLAALGMIMLLAPGPLLHGLQLAGPYMFLLTGAVAAIVSFGLYRLNNLARRAAIMVCFAGMVMLLPKVSADAADISPRFFIAGSMVVIRMMIVWYLWQIWIAEKFH